VARRGGFRDDGSTALYGGTESFQWRNAPYLYGEKNPKGKMTGPHPGYIHTEPMISEFRLKFIAV